MLQEMLARKKYFPIRDCLVVILLIEKKKQSCEKWEKIFLFGKQILGSAFERKLTSPSGCSHELPYSHPPFLH